MKQAATVHPRGGWRQEENDLLFAAVKEAAAEGKPLRDVFAKVGEELHRKPNSIRNYYYAKVKEEPELAPSKATFRAFDQEELHLLLRDVLMAKGRGESVRACVIRRAEGDRSAMLRYQNKYRSVLKNRPELLMEVAEELRQEGLPCPENVVACRRYSPSEQAACVSRLPEGWEREPGVSTVLEGLGMLLRRMEAQAAALKERAEAEEAAGLWSRAAGLQSESVNLQDERMPTPMGLSGTSNATELSGEFEASDEALAGPEAVKSDVGMMQTPPIAQVPYEKWIKARQEADRLRVEVDLLKIALEEAEKGSRETEQE